MSVKPIPLKVLIHTVEYHEKSNDTRYGTGYLAPITINNVLVTPSSKVSIVSSVDNNEKKETKGILFVDVINSKPATELKPQSKIVFNGLEMIVSKVKPIYGFDLHHYEVELT